MLLMIDSYSNMYISKVYLYYIYQEQIELFCNEYGLEIRQTTVTYLFSNKKSSINIPPDSFPIDMFLDYLCSSAQFLSYLETLKLILIINSLSYQTYSNIKTRNKYFYDNKVRKMPKESCLSCLFRLIFTNLPSPNHFDYYPKEINKKNFSDIIYSIKICFRERDFVFSPEPLDTYVSTTVPQGGISKLSIKFSDGRNSTLINNRKKSKIYPIDYSETVPIVVNN